MAKAQSTSVLVHGDSFSTSSIISEQPKFRFATFLTLLKQQKVNIYCFEGDFYLKTKD